MSKTFHYAFAIATLLSLAACASSAKPERLISSVTTGMTEGEVMKRLGPPEHEYADTANDCFQYTLGEDEAVPFAVYFDDQHRVIAAARANCRGRLR